MPPSVQAAADYNAMVDWNKHHQCASVFSAQHREICGELQSVKCLASWSMAPLFKFEVQ